MSKPFRQVRVRQKKHAKRDCISLFCRQHLVGGGLREFFIGDVTPAKSGLQLRPDAPFAQRFTGANKGDAPSAQFARHIS
jgi:hypothetical protein